LVEPVKLMTVVFGERGICGDWPKPSGREGRVDARETCEEEDAHAVALGEQAIAPRMLEFASSTRSLRASRAARR